MEVLFFGNVCQDHRILVLHHPARNALAERVAMSRGFREVFDSRLLGNLQALGLGAQLMDHDQGWFDQTQDRAGQLFLDDLLVGFGETDFGEALEKPFDVVLFLKRGRDLLILEVEVDGCADQDGVGDEEKNQDWIGDPRGFEAEKGDDGCCQADKGNQADDLERGLS